MLGSGPKTCKRLRKERAGTQAEKEKRGLIRDTRFLTTDTVASNERCGRDHDYRVVLLSRDP